MSRRIRDSAILAAWALLLLSALPAGVAAVTLENPDAVDPPLRGAEMFKAPKFDGALATPKNKQLAGEAMRDGLRQAEAAKLDAAIAAYSEAIRLDPKNPFAYKLRGDAKLSQGDRDGAITDYSVAIGLDPKDASVYRLRSRAKTLKGDTIGAERDLAEAVRLDPVLSALRPRGGVKPGKDDKEGPVRGDPEARFPDTKDANEFCRRGDAEQAKGQFGAAIADYTEAIRLDPKFAYAYFSRAETKRQGGGLEAAITDLSSAIRLNPQVPRWFKLRGAARFEAGDYSGAVDDYTEGLRGGNVLTRGRQPGPPAVEDFHRWDGATLVARAKAKRCEADLDGAIADATEALRLNEEKALALEVRAWAKKEAGYLAGAIDDLDAALRIDDWEPSGYWNRGLLEYDLGRWNDASEDLGADPDPDPWTWAPLIAWIVQARLGNRGQADAQLRLRLPRDPPAQGAPAGWIDRYPRFLLGQLTEEQVIRWATEAPGALAIDRTCEACFYAGAKRLVEGDKAGAVALFRKSVATGKRHLVEYDCAVSDLRRLVLGAYAAPIPKAARDGLPLKEGVGLAVSRVARSGPAAGAGLRDGDIVASLAGKEANRGELLRLLTEGKIGEKVRIEFLRQGQRQAADLALGVWNPAPRKEGETDF